MRGAGLIGIAVAARQAGLTPHTLRAWEQRYGFPCPRRTASGERLYPVDQVEKLLLLRRLTESGHRPGRIAGLPVAVLEQMAVGLGEGSADDAVAFDAEAYRRCLTSASVPDLRRRLRAALVRQGLGPFVRHTMGPLVRQIGAWWEAGQIDVYQEHLFSEEAERLLREAMTPLDEHRPVKIVLTTFPSERHALGLLMVEVLLRLEGAACIPLGLETPPEQIVKLVVQSGAEIVALSFSAAYAEPNGRRFLSGLRHDLPASVALWAGGAGAGKVARGLRGVQVFRELEALVAAFRQRPVKATAPE